VSISDLSIPEERASIMARAFGDSWQITETPDVVEVRGALRLPHVIGVAVVLRGSRAQVYAALWGLLRSLEK
jgi:hypothetical protein